VLIRDLIAAISSTALLCISATTTTAHSAKQMANTPTSDVISPAVLPLIVTFWLVSLTRNSARNIATSPCSVGSFVVILWYLRRNFQSVRNFPEPESQGRKVCFNLLADCFHNPIYDRVNVGFAVILASDLEAKVRDCAS
jgi:hypothetical protein